MAKDEKTGRTYRTPQEDAALRHYRDTRGRNHRRIGAITRAAHRSLLTPQEQVETLDARLGTGIGAERERARLESQQS